MDERAFIDQKQASWHDLSSSIELIRTRGVKSLGREQLISLGAQYRALVSDLAFTRSQEASPDLIFYLNDLAGRAHGVLYASKSTRTRGSIDFVFREFPRLFRSTFKYTLVAMLIFFIGWGTAVYYFYTNPDAAKDLIPAKISGRKGGDDLPFRPDPAQMSSFIMTNNIQVGIITFAGGITFGAYSVFELFKNGLVIGAVATLAAPIMGQVRFWSLILPHGIIELMAIFICGGAGFLIGASLIAPGNLRRADAVRIAAAKALKLFAGAVIFFIVAAMIEGFITPSVFPAWTKLTFAGVTAVALIAYLGFAGRQQSAKALPGS